jgi:hypothetical protein
VRRAKHRAQLEQLRRELVAIADDGWHASRIARAEAQADLELVLTTLNELRTTLRHELYRDLLASLRKERQAE